MRGYYRPVAAAAAISHGSIPSGLRPVASRLHRRRARNLKLACGEKNPNKKTRNRRPGPESESLQSSQAAWHLGAASGPLSARRGRRLVTQPRVRPAR
jgi:hypothetical protein